MLDLFRLN